MVQFRDLVRERAPFLVPLAELWVARERARRGDRDAAIAVMRQAVDELHQAGRPFYGVWGTGVLVETLVERGAEGDLTEAQEAIDWLANLPADDGSAMRDIWLLRLRALLSRATATMLPTGTWGSLPRDGDISSASKDTSPGPRRCHDGGWAGARASRSRGRLSQSTPGRDHGGYAGAVSHHPARPIGEPRSAGAAGSGHHRSRSLRRPSPRCRTARRPHTCSASWPACSIRPDQPVESVPNTVVCGTLPVGRQRSRFRRTAVPKVCPDTRLRGISLPSWVS